MSFLSLEHALNYIVQKVSWAAYQHHVVQKRGKVRYTFLIITNWFVKKLTDSILLAKKEGTDLLILQSNFDNM